MGCWLCCAGWAGLPSGWEQLGITKDPGFQRTGFQRTGFQRTGFQRTGNPSMNSLLDIPIFIDESRYSLLDIPIFIDESRFSLLDIPIFIVGHADIH